MIAYDENGTLREFPEYAGYSVCGHCKRMYRQIVLEQVPGFRDYSEDICPYCKESNGGSMDDDYINYALTSDELASLK